MAPCDFKYNFISDYTNKCIIPRDCGIGLNRYGFYVCAVAGSIDRVNGNNIGLKELPSKDSDFNEQSKIFCSLCGHFNERLFTIKNKSDNVDVNSQNDPSSLFKA